MERRLAAILAADVVGYTRLMGADEAGTLARLKALRQELIDPEIARHNGRLVKLMGDGALVEFASVVDAVECAATIQRAMASHNADTLDDERIAFRIGVNLGDVIVEGEDIYGDGVNIAARLEGLAEPGGICISGAAFNQVKGKVEFGFAHQGEREVKNVAGSVSVYQVLLEPEQAGRIIEIATPTKRNWRRSGLPPAVGGLLMLAGLLAWQRPWEPDVEPAAIERMAFPLPEKPSIAVLPFNNLSGDPVQEYWIDGTTEAVITALSKTPNLLVIARNSIFRYKGKAVEVREIAEEFGVRYVLEGSIQRDGDRVRVNAQLIDGLSGRHVWAEQFDRAFDDLFALQDDLTREVVTALEVKLTEGEQARIWRRQTDSRKAYELFRKALELYRRSSKPDNQEARKLFAEAAATDPKFADAACLEGFTYIRAGLFGWEKPRSEAFAKGRELAERAIALDPNYPHAYALLATIETYEGDIDTALAHYERSLALEPNYANNAGGYAYALAFASRGAEAAEQIERAMRLNPYYPNWFLHAAGSAYRLTGRMDEAVAAYEKRVERNPRSFFPKLWLAGLYAEVGRQADAEAMMAKVLKSAPKLTTMFAARFLPYKEAAVRETILDSLRKAGLPDKPPLPIPDKPSIAVLPFANMSGDKEQEYFADGMTEDLITDLSKISGLFVIARNSSFTYKGKPVDVKQVSRELGVRYVLEGSVRRAGDTLRINAQLIDATTGGHLWAERYDGTLDDIFALQDRVTERIVAALALNLTPGEEQRQAQRETDNTAAYDAFLQGWEYYRRFTADDFVKAISYLERSVKLDPEYGRAYAALALVYWESVRQGDPWTSTVSPDAANFVSFTNSRLKADKYLDLAMKNPSPLAHRVASAMSWDYRQFDDAVAEAEQAVALDPNDPDGHVALAWAMIFDGRPQDALAAVERATRLDPQNPGAYMYVLGMARLALSEYEDAVTALRHARERSPDYLDVNVPLAAAYAQLGRHKEARVALKRYTDVWRTFANDVDGVMGWWPFKRETDVRRFGGSLVQAGLCCEELLEQYIARVRRGGTLQ